MARRRIDLHAHSTASDGTDPPAGVIAAAAAAALDVVALTDNDTTGGWDEAATALPAGLALVRGAEFGAGQGRGGRPTRAGRHVDVRDRTQGEAAGSQQAQTGLVRGV